MESSSASLPPQVGDTVTGTIVDIQYERYVRWCQSIGIPPEQAAPKFRYARNGGVGSTGGGSLWSESSEREKKAYSREKARRRADVERIIASL